MQTLDELRQRAKAILLDFKAREQKSEKILEKINEYEKAIAKLQKSLSLVLGMAGGAAAGKAPRAEGEPVVKRPRQGQSSRRWDLAKGTCPEHPGQGRKADEHPRNLSGPCKPKAMCFKPGSRSRR